MVTSWGIGFLTCYSAGNDWVSQGLVMLSLLLMAMICLESGGQSKGLMVTSASLCLCLVMAFLRSSLIMFYIFYERSLVPIALIVLAWGYQPERLISGIYILFYTLSASMPLLWVILLTANSFPLETWALVGSFREVLIGVRLIASFLVKLPAYGLHLWLPLAHVEAPKEGSMALAGLLLKLGCYGLYIVWRYVNLFWFLVPVLLYGGFLSRLAAYTQRDLKGIIAYSRVVHMSWIPLACVFSVESAFIGLLLISIGHGLCSSGLFCSCSTFYERFHRRSLLVLQGGLVFVPGLLGCISYLIVFNCRVPPSIRWIGELILGTLIFPRSWLVNLRLFRLVFFRIGYTLLLYSKLACSNKLEGYRMSLVQLKDLRVARLHTYWQLVALRLMVLIRF